MERALEMKGRRKHYATQATVGTDSTPSHFLRWLCLLLASSLCAAEPEPQSEAKASGKTAEPARIEISGYGFFGNRNLRKMLEATLFGEKKPATLDATAIEDAAFLLLSQIRQDGFLRPRLTARLTLEDGQEVAYEFDEPTELMVLPELQATKAHFIVREGVRYHFAEINFTGLDTIEEDQARAFFVETGVLLPLDRYRIYTPQKLDRGLASLIEILHREGYQQARATVEDLDRDDRTGRVSVLIKVEEGPRSIVRSVREEVLSPDAEKPRELRTEHPNRPYSRLWEQDYAQKLRTNYYHQGYPDVTVNLRVLKREPEDGVVSVQSLAEIKTGPRVKVGEIRFVGNERTKESVLDRRVLLKEGAWLDRVRAEQDRFRLSRLGIFDSAELAYEPAEGKTRDVIYRLEEGKRIDLSLLFGYGSYELLRGGFELSQHNLFGRAHQSRLRAVQSFKSSRATYTYTMPEFLGEDWDVFIRGSALRREEVTFLRTEYGGGAGMQRFFRAIDSTIALRYEYQVLSASQLETEIFGEGVQNPAVGAFIFDLRHDRRDNPLYPRRGYKVFGNLELGSDLLLGDVNYQRFEFNTSYHRPLDRGRWLNFGLSHGLVASMGSPEEDLPFTRRFFPGGENSIRGYQEGEASPLNARGKAIGAETYTLGTVEFEQALTPVLSFVLFTDSMGMARRLTDYPFRETLFSAGGGLRLKTLIGPVRLEYGHNLNPRKEDPSGTLHFSLGFPF